ncbi:MAG: prepilin-type N-terminal cleavage/methylation domain-containing protein, partial [Gammaproteobacteria bacterium]|nr:prepilin-type N-terminal cleavage/methylation domain-containing protein [Gammaproteobacteria bacterium]
MHIVQTKFRYQHGLSLIELMISLLLGALLLFGVFRIFDTNQQTARMANAFSRVQEGGRISMEMIARDIRMADHWGCTPGVS